MKVGYEATIKIKLEGELVEGKTTNEMKCTWDKDLFEAVNSIACGVPQLELNITSKVII